jgi:hypothetical protein
MVRPLITNIDFVNVFLNDGSIWLPKLAKPIFFIFVQFSDPSRVRKCLQRRLLIPLEPVQVLDLRRMRVNFISGEAKFAAVCGQYGENFNEA